MVVTSDPEGDDRETLVQRIIETLSFRYDSTDSSPIGVLYWFDQWDLTADQWRRIEERLTLLTHRVQTQRQIAEGTEAWRRRHRR